MCLQIVLAFMLCVVAVSAKVEDYRFTVTNENGQMIQKDVQFNEKEKMFVIKFSDGRSRPIKTEMHDLKTGYAAMKEGNTQCIVGKSHYTVDNMKDSLVAELKKNSSMASPSIYMEDRRPAESADLQQAGKKIQKFCGSLTVLKATPKKTRSRLSTYRRRFCKISV